MWGSPGGRLRWCRLGWGDSVPVASAWRPEEVSHAGQVGAPGAGCLSTDGVLPVFCPGESGLAH